MRIQWMAAALFVTAGCHIETSTRDDEKRPYRYASEVALPEEVRAALEHADSLELLSLHPMINGARFAEPERPTGESFYDHEILGRSTIEAAAERRAMIEAVYEGIVDSDGTVAACFDPRRGIRAVRGDSTVDLVICFECLQIAVYVDDEHRKGVLTTQHGKNILTSLLTQRGIRVHP